MDQPTHICDECGSEYFPSTSPMVRLCPNCAHYLYGYENCVHEFVEGRCRKCRWDGSTSAYVASVQESQGGKPS